MAILQGGHQVAGRWEERRQHQTWGNANPKHSEKLLTARVVPPGWECAERSAPRAGRKTRATVLRESNSGIPQELRAVRDPVVSLPSG